MIMPAWTSYVMMYNSQHISRLSESEQSALQMKRLLLAINNRHCLFEAYSPREVGELRRAASVKPRAYHMATIINAFNIRLMLGMAAKMWKLFNVDA